MKGDTGASDVGAVGLLVKYTISPLVILINSRRINEYAQLVLASRHWTKGNRNGFQSFDSKLCKIGNVVIGLVLNNIGGTHPSSTTHHVNF